MTYDGDFSSGDLWGWGGGVVVNLHLVKYGDIGLGDPWHLLWYWRVIYKDKIALNKKCLH